MEYGQKVKIYTLQRVNPGIFGMSISEGRVVMDTSTVSSETEVEILGFNDKEVTYRLDDGQVWTSSLEEFNASMVPNE